MTIEGGIRDRLIHDSLFNYVKDFLTSEGWLNTNRRHTPITFIRGFPLDDDPVARNTLAFSMGDTLPIDAELGSTRYYTESVFYLDFFAEDDAVGLHVASDLQNLLLSDRVIEVYDYRSDVDPVVFTVEVMDDVERRKPNTATNEWQKYWHVVSFSVIDEGRP